MSTAPAISISSSSLMRLLTPTSTPCSKQRNEPLEEQSIQRSSRAPNGSGSGQRRTLSWRASRHSGGCSSSEGTMQPNKKPERLSTTGILKVEPAVPDEIDGLVRSATARLIDAQKTSNSPESRFDLAYNAAHAFALAALRFHRYRSEKRYIVFQVLPHTLGVAAPTWRLLDRCHRERNATEYEGLGALTRSCWRASSPQRVNCSTA